MADSEFDVIDDEDRQAQQRAGGVPISWKAGPGGQTVGRDMLVCKPNAHEVNVFSRTRVRTCGSCRYFAHEHFQQRQVKRGFIRRLWEEWGPEGHKYVGDRPDKLGRCREDAELAVGPNSLGCSHYKVK